VLAGCVASKINLALERPGAHLACERLEAGVLATVGDEVGRLTESLATLVKNEVGRLTESLATLVRNEVGRLHD